MNGLFALKFRYQHPPCWVVTVQWERQAFARVAAQAFQVAQQQHLVLASAWHPPTEAHHVIPRKNYWAAPGRWTYAEWCDPVARKIVI